MGALAACSGQKHRSRGRRRRSAPGGGRGASSSRPKVAQSLTNSSPPSPGPSGCAARCPRRARRGLWFGFLSERVAVSERRTTMPLNDPQQSGAIVRPRSPRTPGQDVQHVPSQRICGLQLREQTKNDAQREGLRITPRPDNFRDAPPRPLKAPKTPRMGRYGYLQASRRCPTQNLPPGATSSSRSARKEETNDVAFILLPSFFLSMSCLSDARAAASIRT
jgi:hypothetical protein